MTFQRRKSKIGRLTVRNPNHSEVQSPGGSRPYRRKAKGTLAMFSRQKKRRESILITYLSIEIQVTQSKGEPLILKITLIIYLILIKKKKIFLITYLSRQAVTKSKNKKKINK